MKALFVIGTRPEAIKLAPVILECQKKKGIQALVCSTGQHKELLDSAFEQWSLIPDIELDVTFPFTVEKDHIKVILKKNDSINPSLFGLYI